METLLANRWKQLREWLHLPEQARVKKTERQRSFAQKWLLDETGNWPNFREDEDGDQATPLGRIPAVHPATVLLPRELLAGIAAFRP